MSRSRAAVVLAFAVMVVALLPGRADAHPLSTTAILLDTGAHDVTGRIELPIDRLALALRRPGLTTAVARQPATVAEIRGYVLAHTAAADPRTGAAWAVAVTGGRVQTIDAVDHLVYDVTLTPPGGAVHDFRLHYDGIVHYLVSHRIFVSIRAAGRGDYTTVGVLDWQEQTVVVPAAGATARDGFLPAVRLGVKHIAGGADHLLFLIMLLLPAPLLARRGRWVPSGDLRRSCVRIVHVVTAFAIGHSITLSLAAFGLVSVPSRVVESLIAASVLVSAVHAIKPVVPGGEAWIAAGFGLMHGLAFATLLGDLSVGRRSLVVDLLGFNLGIELTQLLVVALLMPSLLLLRHPAVRVGLASAGVILAGAWLAERTTLIASDPLERVTDGLVAHPFAVAGTFALAAAVAWVVPRVRRPDSPFSQVR